MSYIRNTLFFSIILNLAFLTSIFAQTLTNQPVNLFNGQDLAGWNISDFGTQGPVYVSNGKIILSAGDGCTGIAYKQDFPVKEYEISLQAMRQQGSDFFCGLTFPVENSFCTFIVGGWGGTVVGLSSLDGLDASENFTGRFRKFSNNQWYSIRVRVSENKITAWIDDQEFVDVEYKNYKLSVRSEVLLSRPFGITSWKTTAALRDIKLTILNKELKE